MSLRNGDKARTHKVATKRRLRRSQMRVQRRLFTSGEDHKVVSLTRIAGAEGSSKDVA